MIGRLVFFDSREQSANGTLRGLIGFLVGLFLAWLTMPVVDHRSLCWLLVMASAVGVFIPSSLSMALVYGACVGLVMFAAVAFSTNTTTPTKGFLGIEWKKVALEILRGIFLSVSMSLAVYLLYWRQPKVRIRGGYGAWQVANVFFFVVLFAWLYSVRSMK